ncbi:MAG: Ig-like domain-containing protein [Flavobacterium sp.]
MFKFRYGFLIVFSAIFMVGCAKRGTITGGAKDTLAPVLKVSIPKNFSTNFSGKEIKLHFDEYVKLKDVNKQLVVSPPMNTAPDISPLSSSKEISIKIKDTLLPNTTYSFNFGQSIQDNNEGNPYPQFKYVFSTGSQIDSLLVEGNIKDALQKKTDNFVTVMLYEMNEKYNDSVVFKQKPRYITNTLESGSNFKIENIKAGNYVLIAVKDLNSNFKYDPQSDKIGFHKEVISVPSTDNYELKLFKQTPPFKTIPPTQVSGNKIILGYEGKQKDLKVILKNGDAIVPSVMTKVEKRDSVQIWFPKMKVDSLYLSATKENYSKGYYLRIKEKKNDTIGFSASHNGLIHFREMFSLISLTPIKNIDESKIVFKNKDSIAVPFKVEYDEFNQKLNFNFKKEPLEKYVIHIAPDAFTDFFDSKSGKLDYKLETKSTAEYGNLTIRLEKVKQFPVIVELTNEKGDVQASTYVEKDPVITFEGLVPAKFQMRVIYDDNKNGEWDPGNFIEKRQAEEVIYFPKELDVRANWDVDQPFDLGN